MKNEDYNREVQTRERLVQIFLIISGFLLAYSKDEIRQFLVLLFILYIIFILLYYIYLTRTKNSFMICFFGFLSSYVFSLFLLTFIDKQLNEPLSIYSFYSSFILLTVIFTFAFISPTQSESLVTRFEKSAKKFENKHSKLSRVILIIFGTIMLIYTIIQTILNFIK